MAEDPNIECRAVQPNPAATAFYLAVGAALTGAASTAGAVQRTVRVAKASPLAPVATAVAGGIARTPAAARLTALAARLEQRGRAEMAVRLVQAQRYAESTVDTVATSDLVIRMVNDVLGQVLWPLIDEVLPGVLDRLAADPAPVQNLVLGQSATMVDELTTTLRTRSATADDKVAGLIDRILHRTRSAAGVMPQPAVPSP